MSRIMFAPLLLSAACSAAHADRPSVPAPPGTAIAIGIAPEKMRAPYDVQVLRENGDTLPTYALKDRFYVQGNDGERYLIRVTNPTANRVEAVITVDGLDVIDGEPGDLRKRGYVVPPFGEVRVEGFRTSQADVATFRFSAVDDSYAGRKGKARNVGVIAVAIFEEQVVRSEQHIIVGPSPRPRPRPLPRSRFDEGGDVVGSRGEPAAAEPPAERAPARKSVDSRSSDRVAQRRAPAAPPASRPAGVGGGAVAPAAPPPDHYEPADDFDAEVEESPAPRTGRAGLGTEFGEQRYSAASFTRFVRNAGRPIAIAELRYNDAGGLVALGIHVRPLPDAGEIMTRETADPFPGDGRFATPPPR